MTNQMLTAEEFERDLFETARRHVAMPTLYERFVAERRRFYARETVRAEMVAEIQRFRRWCAKKALDSAPEQVQA